MAAHLLVLYGKPNDVEEFDAYYAGTHVPIAKKIPGLKRYSVSREVKAADGSPPPYHLIADLEFASADDIGAAFASPEGQAAAADVPKFATGGVKMFVYESVEV